MTFVSPLKGVMTPIDKRDSVEVLDYKLDYPIERVDLSIGVVNTVPLSGKLKILMGNHPDTMYVVTETAIPLGTLQNHRLKEPFVNRYEIPIAEEFYSIIKREPLYYQRDLHYDGTMGNEVWLFADDSVKVQASLTFYYKIDPGDNGGK